MREHSVALAVQTRLDRASPEATFVYATPLALEPGLSGEIVLQRAGRACLDHLIGNQEAALSGDAEGVHQMRVAVRRLRGFLSALAPFLPPKPRRWASEELHWFADALGEARNLDVFASALLAPARAALPEATEFERLAIAIGKRRQIAHAEARMAIRSIRYAASVSALIDWFDGRAWRSDDEVGELLRPIIELAPIVLGRCRYQVEKRSKRFAKQSEEQRHGLRIALKKLRYVIELLASLYRPEQTKQAILWLKRLQDDLGDINDVQMGRDIVANLVEPAPRTGIGYAGRRMLGWHKRRLADHEPQLREHLRRLLETEPFWLPPRIGAVVWPSI